MKKTKLFTCSLALLAASQGMFAAGKGDAAKGKEVFEQCGVCHNADNTEKKMGPGLKGLFTHDKMMNAIELLGTRVTPVLRNELAVAS